MDNYYGNICYCRRCNGVVHTIKKGDTLYLISKYYKVPIGEIMGANRNINIYNLQIGDEICIPVRRPEPRENEITDNMMNNTNNMNNMGRSMGNTNTMGSFNTNTRAMQSGMQEMPEAMSEGISDMSEMQMDMMGMSDNINSRETIMEADDAVETMAEEASVQEINVNDMKVSELIGGKDMTVEELAKLLKKYM